MQQPSPINKSRTLIYHFAGWIVFYYFWYRYFTPGDARLMANLYAGVTTFFAAATFYITIYVLVPSHRKGDRALSFILTAGIFILVLSFCRTICMLVLLRLFVGAGKGFNFMGQLFTSIFHISYIFIFAIAIKSYADKQKEQVRAEKEIKERLAAELEFLKNQVNPHFLFNIHNSIYFLIHDDPRRAEKAVLMLSEIMRYQIYECNSAFVSLEKELHNISNYIELEKMRIGNKVNVEYSFDNYNNRFTIAPFILLSLVENAFKHISDFTNGSNFINITASVKENVFSITVINSTEEVIENNEHRNYSTGIGIKNLSRRLELIYPGKHELILSRQDKIFTATLKLPANDAQSINR